MAKRLADNPDLDHYRRQAKVLRKALAAAEPIALERLRRFHPRTIPGRAAKLADAQLVLAREHGFASWPAFAARVETLRNRGQAAFPGGIVCDRGTLAVETGGMVGARAIVLFVLAGNVGPRHHGISQIADHLRRAGYGTILADLLTPEEATEDAMSEELRFDVELLTSRAELVLAQIQADPATAQLPLALFCAGAGGAPGVFLAARHRESVSAMVSLAGRPDLAGSAMARIRAPALFIVGGEDAVAHGFTRLMLEISPRDVATRLEVVSGVGLRFEEGPAAARAAQLALGWLETHLGSGERAEQAA